MKKEFEKISKESKDIAVENIEKLKELFPDIVSENKIDIEKLQALLGDEADTANERYGLSWNGKSGAIKAALRPTGATLRPDKESSKDWDTTENLYIEGDNLEVLKVLRQSYRGEIKMIYIDPPYNTGKDFVYKDNFRQTAADYVEESGQGLVKNPDTSGRYHSNWLNMMYPRLRVARDLLTDDGVIFVSIDDNEVHNLRMVMNEVFGEEKFVGTFKWNRVAKAPSLSDGIRTKFEYIHCYKKNQADKFFGKESYNTQAPVWHNPNKQQELRFAAKSIEVPGSFSKGEKSQKYNVELLDDIIEENGLNKYPVRIKACSAWGQDKIDSYINEGNRFQIKKSIGTLYSYLPNDGNYVSPSDILTKQENGINNNTDASEYLKALGIPFTNPKPVSLIKYLINAVLHIDKEARVLDFFSGSAATAHAVMQLNAEDGGNRKHIMVQIAEETDEKSEAYKAGYKTIPEIGRERIRRAGEKIKEDFADKLAERKTPLDVGFKTFKLDTTNLKSWDDMTDNIEGELFNMLEPIKDGRSQEDVVYEILLKYGIDITKPIETKDAAGAKYFIMGAGYLAICLEPKLTLEQIEAIAVEKPSRVVFYDNAFADDVMKLNAEKILTDNGVKEIRVI